MIKRMTINNILSHILSNTSALGDTPTVGVEFNKLAEVLKGAQEHRRANNSTDEVEVELRHTQWTDLDFNEVHSMRILRIGNIEMHICDEEIAMYSVGATGIGSWIDLDNINPAWEGKLV